MDWIRGPTIGHGSTATVSLATSLSSGEPLAVKSTELSNSMFLQKEQLFLSKISCPYIVKYIGYNITNENNKALYNLCLEYAAGGTLFDVVQRHEGRKLEEAMIRIYTRDILRGINYLHSEGLVHCDMKSKNVLINEEGRAMIADFGCARYAEFCGGDTSAFSGTPVFMSPEVARGEEQGFPADVWALGCTIIEMATGNLPWCDAEFDDNFSALYRIGFSNDLPEIPSKLSANGMDFLSKCLQRDPRARWTAKELLDHPFLDGLETQEDKEFTSMSCSPSCVLDQGFWDSMEGLESPQDLTLDNYSNSPAERIKRLVFGFSLSSVSDPVPNWSSEEDWVTVRSVDIEEPEQCFKEHNTVNFGVEGSFGSATFTWDSITYEEEFESSIFYEELLLNFCIENVSSNSNVSVSGGDNFVSGNVNFDTYNKKSLFSSISFLFFFFSYL